ncbi:MAG TPA: hypothetical protein VGS80_10975, partial [Ktedonobacterales bacterium]|nr:hypothetical protein [Ktedonobacterales bacterium]
MNALSRVSAALHLGARWTPVLKAQVNMLRRIAAVLRPGGVLLNLLPDTTHRAVAVRVGGGAIQRLGHLDDTRDIKE